MIHHQTKALHSTRTTTLQELLDEGYLDQLEHSRAPGTYQCTDESIRPMAAGGWANCLRCELLACRDASGSTRNGSEVEIVTEAQVYIRPFAGVKWD